MNRRSLTIYIHTGKAHKICTSNGTWYRHPMTNRYWSNYTTCVDTVDLAVSRSTNQFTLQCLYYWSFNIVINYYKLRSTIRSLGSGIGFSSLILVFQIGAKFIQAEAHFLISIFHFRPIITIPSKLTSTVS